MLDSMSAALARLGRAHLFSECRLTGAKLACGSTEANSRFLLLRLEALGVERDFYLVTRPDLGSIHGFNFETNYAEN